MIQKYRAWDKTRNIYGEVLEISWPCGENDDRFPDGHKGRLSLYNPKNEADCGFWGIWIEKADLEQFIGRHDKNGKEIYEGDVMMRFTGSYAVMRYLEDQARFMWCIDLPSGVTFVYPPLSSDEVVTNIHEFKPKEIESV